MALLALLEEDTVDRGLRRDRVFSDREDLLAHDDDWLISRFRLPRAVLLQLCAELGPELERTARRNHAISVQTQVLTRLSFLATGSYQHEMADRSGISQPSLSALMPAMLDAIIKMSIKCIKFPYTVEEQTNIKRQFAAMTDFPNVIGIVGTPSSSGFLFRSWTPKHHKRFTTIMCMHALAVLERAIGLLKCRWRCLDASGGKLLYKPSMVCRILMACGVLHNVALRNGIPIPRMHRHHLLIAITLTTTPRLVMKSTYSV
ncbi:hypothetical protein WMY93_007355 [Mugilogobius chulae]|uniref:Nuclease HARBI1 n=1 Tax=Mugilogobius chulae TaxID=88201 RepID=A0AAW0PGF0_9GOBI